MLHTMMAQRKINIALLTFLLTLSAHADNRLRFEDAVIPEAPPGAKTMAAYLTINNPSDSSTTIIEVSSHEFDTAEIHRSTVKNGVAKMEHVSQLTIPAKSQVIMSPGGLHIMLIDPVQPLLPGELVSLRFKENNGTEHSVTLKIKFDYYSNQHDDHQHH